MANYKKILSFIKGQEPKEFVKAILIYEGGLEIEKDEAFADELAENFLSLDNPIPNLLDNELHEEIEQYKRKKLDEF
jgi:hypothetical protein